MHQVVTHHQVVHRAVTHLHKEAPLLAKVIHHQVERLKAHHKAGTLRTQVPLNRAPAERVLRLRNNKAVTLAQALLKPLPALTL